MLKQIRVIIALVIFTSLTFFFVDFASIAPKQTHFFASLQLVPSILAVNIAIIIFVVLLTLFMGRFYCSTICPLGVMQDFFSASYHFLHRKNKKKLRSHFSFRKENKYLRYGLFILFIVLILFSMTTVAALIEPYSVFGRIASSIFKPVYITINNVLASFFDNTFYKIDIFTIYRNVAVLIVSLVSFFTISYLSFRFGRIYCNSVCPAGTALGLLSRFSFFKIRINKQSCNSCGVCSWACKSECIDAKNKKIDYSRCVSCFNCIETCKRGALSYSSVLKKDESKVENQTLKGADSISRKDFIGSTLLLFPLLTLFFKKLSAAKSDNLLYVVDYQKKNPLSPPGSLSYQNLLQRCVACHLCVSKCPSNVLKPSLLEYGLGGFMAPEMNFDKGFCNFDCTVCSDVCPTGAIKPITKQQKHSIQAGRVVFVSENCIVKRLDQSCGACSEHCPTQAVTMIPYGTEGLTIPKTYPDLCVGCGGCEYVCPAKPFKAIYIEGSPVQGQAIPFKQEKKFESEIEDFGF